MAQNPRPDLNARLSEEPGLPVTGVLYNPRSHRNRDHTPREVDHPVIRVEQPQRRRDLKDAMQRFVDSGVELLVINGGDGTVRDALTGGNMVFGDKWPDLAVLPRGKTNALTMDLEMPGEWTLEEAILAHRDGRKLTRRPLVVEPLGDVEDALVRLGFILGAGAFVAAIDSGQGAHKLGAFQNLAVVTTAVWGFTQALFGTASNPWRRGAQMDVRLGQDSTPLAHSGHGEPGRRSALFASTLTRFPAGLDPFSELPGPIRIFAVDLLRRRLALVLPPFLKGWRPDTLEAMGIHRHSTDQLELDFGDGFILDGERFDPGRYRVTPGPELTFVVP
ncbi:diacylglycerol/lipid kinase family protein [Qipengyuania sp. DSG2-2]|uniref:diacylglycerol/lipid kinase family protein n=1 Tax=Qipengyuania sp. DGS2-2 TaxID=3349631 RepID=UPI0036D28FC6